jgi:DNA-binding transcriptional MerR regulator
MSFVNPELECKVKHFLGTNSSLTLNHGSGFRVGCVKIHELADQVGLPTSTVRYYERIGLMPPPDRTESGYRNYDDSATARLLFITRGRNMGLTCEQMAELLPIWNGANCEGAHSRVSELLRDKRVEIRERIAELERFDAQLGAVGDALDEAPPPAACRTDLSCCVPETGGTPISVELGAKPVP